jgi:putative oxidoreductase
VEKLLVNYAPHAYAILRIVVGLLFLCHGLQKVFGLFGGTSVPLSSLLGVAGITYRRTLITLDFSRYCSVHSQRRDMAYFMGYFPASFGPLNRRRVSSFFFFSLCGDPRLGYSGFERHGNAGGTAGS